MNTRKHGSLVCYYEHDPKTKLNYKHNVSRSLNEIKSKINSKLHK